MDGTSGGNSTKFTNKSNVALGIIQRIGTVVSVIMVAGIGIKYMLGSVEENSHYKETIIPYLIGAVLLFSATTIPNIIYQFVHNL